MVTGPPGGGGGGCDDDCDDDDDDGDGGSGENNCPEPGACQGVESSCGWDLVCITAIASSYTGIAGCYSCTIDPTKLTCVPCIGSLVSAGITTFTCDPTNGCEYHETCDPCHCDNPIPPGCGGM